MNVLYAGNVANVGYLVTRQMRRMGIDMDLLMEKNPPIEQDPIKQDPDLNNQYPPWIFFYKKNESGWKRKIIKKMRDKKYDIIHGHYDLIIFGYLARKTLIAHPVGDDMRTLAFSKTIRGYMMRRALKKAKVILYGDVQSQALLKKLKLSNGVFIPFLHDYKFFKTKQQQRQRFKDKLLIFHPTFLTPSKGNEILIKGFSKFITNNPDSILLILDRGPDSEKIHQIVKKLNLDNNVQFIQGPLDSIELLQLYNEADIIADQFVVGDIGGIGREVLSCSKPLLTFCKLSEYQQLYGDAPPLANASNQIEIAQQLEFLKDFKNRNELSIKGLEWVKKHHSPEIFGKKMEIIYKSVIEGIKADQIQEKLSKISK